MLNYVFTHTNVLHGTDKAILRLHVYMRIVRDYRDPKKKENQYA
jgi:hypothetical protein